MPKIILTKDNVGDRINFRVPCRWGWAKGPRIVRDVNPEDQMAFVKCDGCDRFIIRFSEISELITNGGKLRIKADVTGPHCLCWVHETVCPVHKGGG